MEKLTLNDHFSLAMLHVIDDVDTQCQLIIASNDTRQLCSLELHTLRFHQTWLEDHL